MPVFSLHDLNRALLAAVVSAAVASPVIAATQSFPYTGSPQHIYDAPDVTTPGPLAVAPLDVAGVSGTISKVVLRIDGSACTTNIGVDTVGIDHSFVRDLVLTLRSPSGSTVTLFNRAVADAPAHNFCQTVFDDDAPTAIQSAVAAEAPFIGSWRPATPLSALHGEPANGTWSLEVQDFAPLDVGNIRAFTLSITTAAAQTILFPAQTPAARPFSAGTTFSIFPQSIADSGLPVSYSSLTAGVCTVAGTTVTMVTPGTCTLAADQAGNLDFTAAPQVTQNVLLTVAGSTAQTINFPAQSPASRTFSAGATFAINPLATASSGLPVTYSSLSTGVCTVSGATVTMVTAGTCQIAANQGGDGTYAAAPQATRSVVLRAEVVNVPTLGQWSLMLLGLAAAGLGMRRLRRAL